MPFQIRPALHSDIAEIARLHRLVLGETLNARLGERHLRRLYRGLLISEYGIVLCACADARIVGFVSGTFHAGQLQADLIRTPGTRILLSLAFGLVLRPWLCDKLVTQFLINRPVVYEQQTVNASLLTLGVAPNFAHQGIGRQLVKSLIAEFCRRGVRQFHLNTLSENERAQSFYGALGGRLLRSWRGNHIYLFVLDESVCAESTNATNDVQTL